MSKEGATENNYLFAGINAIPYIGAYASLATSVVMGGYGFVQGGEEIRNLVDEGKYLAAVKILDIIINIKSIVKNLKSYCFVEGTIVRTSEGNKAIEEVQIGEYVYAKDEETGETTLKEVLDTSISESQHLVTVKVGQDTIEATPNHCFWIEEKGWVEAGDLQVGDKVVLQKGKTLEIENI